MSEELARIQELDQRATETEAQIRTLDQQLAAASGQQRAALESQLRALVGTHGSAVEEANRLRIQLGVPVVVPNVALPSIMTDQPVGQRKDEWSTTQGE